MMVLITGARMLTRTRLTRRSSRPASRAAERHAVSWRTFIESDPRMSAGTQIVRNFVSELKRRGLTVSGTGVSRNVWKVTGALGSRQVNCLLYVKGRGEAPYRWGVTANVIARLSAQTLQWNTVLLYESKDTGYFLTSANVLHCIQSVGPLGADGDYKPAPGSYLNTATPFSSFPALLALL